jgi:hypothetical protein
VDLEVNLNLVDASRRQTHINSRAPVKTSPDLAISPAQPSRATPFHYCLCRQGIASITPYPYRREVAEVRRRQVVSLFSHAPWIATAMSTPRPGAHNGGPVGNRVSQPSMSTSQSLSRPFTLYEALPYTPFTSIVPFDSGTFAQCALAHLNLVVVFISYFARTLLFTDAPQLAGILPAPTIGSVSPAPSLIDLVTSQEFDALNQEALAHDPLPRRLQQTANQIQHLVERNGITELYACSHAAAKRRKY